MVIIDTVINTLLGGLTLDPASMHCPAGDDAFVSSYYCYYHSTKIIAQSTITGTHHWIHILCQYSSVKLSTVGSRAFPAAASSIWNSLPEYIVSAFYSTVISTSSENFPVPTFISGHSSVVNIF